MATEMVERVARAMAGSDDPEVIRSLRGVARRAIEAIREPTPEMIRAAAEFHANGNWNISDESIFGGIFRAMIDAAQNYRAEGVDKGAMR